MSTTVLLQLPPKPTWPFLDSKERVPQFPKRKAVAIKHKQTQHEQQAPTTNNRQPITRDTSVVRGHFCIQAQAHTFRWCVPEHHPLPMYGCVPEHHPLPMYGDVQARRPSYFRCTGTKATFRRCTGSYFDVALRTDIHGLVAIICIVV